MKQRPIVVKSCSRAAAVGVGRPMVWGLGAFGQSGVERVIDLINSELRIAMLYTGAKHMSDIGAEMLSR